MIPSIAPNSIGPTAVIVTTISGTVQIASKTITTSKLVEDTEKMFDIRWMACILSSKFAVGKNNLKIGVYDLDTITHEYLESALIYAKLRCDLDSEQLGQRIRIRREQLGLSQEELGELVEKDQKAISQYEKGTRRVLAVDIQNLSRALQVSILYFFEEEVSQDDMDWEPLESFHRLPTTHYQRMVIKAVDELYSAILESMKDSFK